MLQNIRAFFSERKVLEIETPILATTAITDPHLESLKTECTNQSLYLHTSPEFFMKRFLAAYNEDIFQICKVFRDDEYGVNHNPEFAMLEWYRIGFDHHRLLDEIEQLFLFLVTQLDVEISSPDVVRVTYQQAFQQTLNIDPLVATSQDLKQCCDDFNIEIPLGMNESDKDMWLDWLMTQAVAPSFSKNGFTFLYDYPASQAALAKLNDDDARVAHRFEVFFGKLELANGFNELTDADQQAARFEAENQLREQRGQEKMPLDKSLLAALKHGMPACAGVAVGLDRLLMVLLAKQNIKDVLTFSFENV